MGTAVGGLVMQCIRGLVTSSGRGPQAWVQAFSKGLKSQSKPLLKGLKSKSGLDSFFKNGLKSKLKPFREDLSPDLSPFAEKVKN